MRDCGALPSGQDASATIEHKKKTSATAACQAFCLHAIRLGEQQRWAMKIHFRDSGRHRLLEHDSSNTPQRSSSGKTLHKSTLRSPQPTQSSRPEGKTKRTEGPADFSNFGTPTNRRMKLQAIIDTDGSCFAGAGMNAKLRDHWSEAFRAYRGTRFWRRASQNNGAGRLTAPR